MPMRSFTCVKKYLKKYVLSSLFKYIYDITLNVKFTILL